MTTVPGIWPMLFLVTLAAVAPLAWTSATHAGRFVQFVRAEDGVHVWINPNAVAQIRESVTPGKPTMIVFTTGVWIDVTEKPAHVVHRLGD